MMLKVVVAAGRSATRSSLWNLVESEPTLDPVGAAATMPAAIRMLRTHRPDLLLVDRRLLDPSGLRMLTAEFTDTSVVLFGMGDHPAIETLALEAGAAAYIRLDEAAERVGGFVDSLVG